IRDARLCAVVVVVRDGPGEDTEAAASCDRLGFESSGPAETRARAVSLVPLAGRTGDLWLLRLPPSRDGTAVELEARGSAARAPLVLRARIAPAWGRPSWSMELGRPRSGGHERRKPCRSSRPRNPVSCGSAANRAPPSRPILPTAFRSGGG